MGWAWGKHGKDLISCRMSHVARHVCMACPRVAFEKAKKAVQKAESREQEMSLREFQKREQGRKERGGGGGKITFHVQNYADVGFSSTHTIFLLCCATLTRHEACKIMLTRQTQNPKRVGSHTQHGTEWWWDIFSQHIHPSVRVRSTHAVAELKNGPQPDASDVDRKTDRQHDTCATQHNC